MKSAQEGGQSQDIWEIREGGLGSTAFARGEDNWPGWEDSAVPPSQLGRYVVELRELMNRYQIKGAMYGHFGQGCIHCRLSFDLRSQDGIAGYRAFLEEAADLVVRYGGSLSGEHGDGQQRAELLEKQYGPELMAAMREFKRIWDPDWKMNPGKVIDPYRLDEDLRLGTSYNPPRPRTKFAYPEEKGDFAHATLRCVGIGKCRVPEGAPTMCPSYQVTREEKHSTRGRARLLFEMLQGEVITDGWQSREVYDALDLCLACKGCTNDCPVNVDMPTYKAEFLYHHYKSARRWRPRYAYAFGYIDKAARLASLVPEVVNFATQTPGLRGLAKLAAGVDRRRPLPRFAPMTLQEWFRRRAGTPAGAGGPGMQSTANPTGRQVVLFPDTFNNYLHAGVGVACVEALEAAGWRVIMPDRHVCCGRPLYDYGFLDSAGRYLQRVLDVLRPYVRQGIPVVGMEPSCLAVFKDELGKMLPHDDDASRLARNAYHFGEFCTAFGIEPPRRPGRVLLWGHCHQRATGGVEPDQQLLQQMGLEVSNLSGGCCGLAGSWGFEAGKYGISMDCGEQALLPAVRQAGPDTLIVADGFSCQTQIADSGTGRRAMHVAEVMKAARDGGSLAGEQERLLPRPPVTRRAARVAAAALPAVAALGASAVAVARRTARAPSRG
jgi:Fe-S oxidoreductase